MVDLSPQRGRIEFPAMKNSIFVEFPRPFAFTPSWVNVKSPVSGVMAFNLTRIGFVCGLQPDVLVEQLKVGELPKIVDDSGEPRTRERDMERHLKNDQQKAPTSLPSLGDFQLKTAVDYLRAAERLAGKNG